jgi:hypothetical protein
VAGQLVADRASARVDLARAADAGAHGRLRRDWLFVSPPTCAGARTLPWRLMERDLARVLLAIADQQAGTPEGEASRASNDTLVHATGLTPKAVARALGQLADAQLIAGVPASGSETLRPYLVHIYLLPAAPRVVELLEAADGG